ncbi:uncharacterized protein LOC119402184 [Rhipicephalus sanguineus]|uniref:uncharacterized protein LOC119402184 n=1 Tax=Rhipicephalus sanguineus TaxID=34632 RepID=UPI0018941C63|nr:uncharacterized protein LOC119402184 [Rhipicephalus sanguineus]
MRDILQVERQEHVWVQEYMGHNKEHDLHLEHTLRLGQNLHLDRNLNLDQDDHINLHLVKSLMDEMLKGLEGVVCYLDDVLIAGESIEECQTRVDTVLARFQLHGARVKQDKYVVERSGRK